MKLPAIPTGVNVNKGGNYLTVSCLIESILLQVGTRKRTIGEDSSR